MARPFKIIPTIRLPINSSAEEIRERVLEISKTAKELDKPVYVEFPNPWAVSPADDKFYRLKLNHKK